jgi:hypothetical protein
MLKKILIAAFIDIIVITIWAYWANSIYIEPMAGIGVILIIPALIILSGVIGFVLNLRENEWGKPILINMFIAFAIFIGVFKYQSWKQQHDNYLTFYFSYNDKIYSVTLYLNDAELQDGSRYNIYERLGEYANAGTDLDGSYTTKNDTLILISEKGKVMKIFGSTLFDYPEKGELVSLRKKPN